MNFRFYRESPSVNQVSKVRHRLRFIEDLRLCLLAPLLRRLQEPASSSLGSHI